MKKVIVIGAGAAGLIASAVCANRGAEVLLLEKNDQVGAKILISGKGRCNLTNMCDQEHFLAAYGEKGARFLRGAFSRFFREDLIALLDSLGVPTKIERGGRVFPASNDAKDVTSALLKHAKTCGVKICYNSAVRKIMIKSGAVSGVCTDNTEIAADGVIVCCGGSSFPKTGSTGDGYTLAKKCGHTVTTLLPSLVPLAVLERETAAISQGTSLKNVRLSLYECESKDIPAESPAHDYGRGIPGKKAKAPLLESRMGEMMMTHFGIGGPITLLVSLAAAEALHKGLPVSAAIDLKPALSLSDLNKRLQREIETHPKRSFQNLLKELVPLKLTEMIIRLSGIDPFKQSSEIKKEERQKLSSLLKRITFNITNTLPLSVAMVTSGGVELNEIDPKTMASKLVRGLYFAGEVLDIDAETGGYNLQAAFSTGYVSGQSIVI